MDKWDWQAPQFTIVENAYFALKRRKRTGKAEAFPAAVEMCGVSADQISSFMLSSRASTIVGTTLVAFSCTSLGA